MIGVKFMNGNYPISTHVRRKIKNQKKTKKIKSKNQIKKQQIEKSKKNQKIIKK